MPTLTEGNRASSGLLAVQLTDDGVEESRQSPSNLLIYTMKLVESPKRLHVPNHLLETKTFTKIGKNSMIVARPEIIHFDGFEVGEKHVKKMEIINASADVLKMHVIPPQSKFFSIKYNKKDRMVPGLTLQCTIEFRPDEWRYYYDCIRINCPGDDNLIVPIHGYPVMSTKEFPRNYNFPVTPVGENVCRVFPLRCKAPVDFEFELVYMQQHPAFVIHPMSGIVPANGQVDISVTFAPYDFSTAAVEVQLVISQFNAMPIVSKFVGTSKPGLVRERTLALMEKEHSEQTEKEHLEQSEILDPGCVSPLDRARSNRKSKIKVKPLPRPPPASQRIEYKGLMFNLDMNSPHAVAKVLLQETGKLSFKDLQNKAKDDPKSETSTYQMKEAEFDHQLRDNIYEERQNQLRWQVKLGDELITSKRRLKILDARSKACSFYKFKRRMDPIPKEEYARQETTACFRRTIRHYQKLAEEGILFDPYTNNMWAARNAALNRFIQAVRKVIIQNRIAWELRALKDFLYNLAEQKASQTAQGMQESDDKMKGLGEEEPQAELTFFAKRIRRVQFPTYVSPDVKDDMAADALGRVTTEPTQVVVKEKVPFFKLKVPQTFALQGYAPHSVHQASSGYVPIQRVKELRTGALDEVITLPTPEQDAEPDPTQSLSPEEAELKKEKKERVKADSAALTLRPPEALFKSIVYPPLHIMNPTPGLQVFQAPMPYAEVDPDFHLCPLPRSTRRDLDPSHPSPTQRKGLDREDTIRGLMTWKKFPSAGMTSLTTAPTLSSVWVPRWDDKFSQDLLPTSVPALLNGLPESEAENIVEESESDKETEVTLTPDMVNANFALIDTLEPELDNKKSTSDEFPMGNKLPSSNIPTGPNGPVNRERREGELDVFMNARYDRLGSKITQKMDALNQLMKHPPRH